MSESPKSGAGSDTKPHADRAAVDPRLDMTTQIVTAYISHNTVAAENVPDFIETVYRTISRIEAGELDDEARVTPVPAIPIAQSVTDDAIYCLEDGLPFKSLKRHLRSKYDLTPEAYREKWGLPADYPMVAVNYAKARSELAKKSGLGRNRAQRY